MPSATRSERGAQLALALLLPLAAACVKPPPATAPDIDVDVPERWTVDWADGGEVAVDWWTLFEDPHLDELIRLVLDRNRDLRAAAARVERAQAEARIAGADLQPALDVSFDAARQKNIFFGLPIPGSPNLSSRFATYGLSLGAFWEIDLWGRLRAATRASLADWQASQADYRGIKLSLAGQTAKVWFGIAEAQQQIELSEATARAFRAQAEQVRLRYEKGVRPAIDLRLALSNLEQAEASARLRRQQLSALLRQLEVLAGTYPSATIQNTFPVEDLLPTPPPIPAGLPTELLERRPDLIVAERRLAASDQRLYSARKALYPRLSLNGAVGTLTDRTADLLDNDLGIWSLFANLTQPIFQGGRLRANVGRAEATRDEVLAAYAGAVLRAFAEVETTLANESFLLERERHLAEAARQLVAAERLAEQRYRLGVGAYLEVLESQTRSFLARSELLNVRRLRLDNRVDLHLALGGGFEIDGPELAPVTRTDGSAPEES